MRVDAGGLKIPLRIAFKKAAAAVAEHFGLNFKKPRNGA
jgi:hypothetical protein